MNILNTTELFPFKQSIVRSVYFYSSKIKIQAEYSSRFKNVKKQIKTTATKTKKMLCTVSCLISALCYRIFRKFFFFHMTIYDSFNNILKTKCLPKLHDQLKKGQISCKRDGIWTDWSTSCSRFDSRVLTNILVLTPFH